MLEHKKFVRKIHDTINLATQEFPDTSVDPDIGLLKIHISYPATPLDASHQPPAILLSAIEEKIFQQQQENDTRFTDPLSLKQELNQAEGNWMQHFWELENKYLQLSESYNNVLQENLRIQTENIRLEQELELSRKYTADLEVRLRGLQIGADIFQKQYFMLQKQNAQLATELYRLQNTFITNVPFTQIDSIQHVSTSTSEEHPQNPQIVPAYEHFKSNRRRHGNGNKSKSILTVVPYQHESSLHQQASHEAMPNPPYKDPPVQHVPAQQQHVLYASSTFPHVPYQADPLPQHVPYEGIEEASVIIPENTAAASSSNSLELPYLPTIQYISDSYNLLRLVKLQYKYAAKHPDAAKHTHVAKPETEIKYMSI